MMAAIHFSGVLGGDDLRLLPRLIQHYSYIGVNGRWLLGVQMASPDDAQLEHAREVVSRYDIDAALVPVVGPWRHRVNTGAIQRMRMLYPNDWTVVADQDEFHVYPDSLDSIVRYCEARGYEAVRGDIVDRLGPNGTLPAIEDGRSLWLTFPLGGDVTRGILTFYSPQVVMVKGSALLSWGSHYVARGKACPKKALEVPVHHFKWDATVVRRLRSRYQLYTSIGEPYAEESKVILDHIAQHGGIDISNRSLRVKYVGNPYGDENMLDESTLLVG
jgi:hypothetical protein